MDFDAELAKLPQAVADHIRGAGLADASLVADSAAPSSVQDGDGKTFHKSVDLVFMEAISGQVDAGKPATGAWALTMRFFRACWAEVNAGAGPEKELEATPLEARDASAEEYYEFSPTYHKQQLDQLNTARRCEVEI